MDSLVSLLKKQPLAAQIESALAEYNSLDHSNVENLELISTLLKHTVPGVYTQLPRSCQSSIANAFSSAIGIGNLISRIDMLIKLKADTLFDLIQLLNTHLELLGAVFSPGLVLKLTRTASQIYVREVDKLLFKGKSYSVLREADMRFNVNVPPVFVSSSSYSGFLSRELILLYGNVDIKYINQYIHSLISISPEMLDQYLCEMFQESNFANFALLVSLMKRFERKQLLLRFIIFAQKNLPIDRPDAVPALSKLIQEVFDTSVWDGFMADSVVARYSYGLNEICAMTAFIGLRSTFTLFVLTCLASWGNANLIAEEPIVRQEYRTHLLICLCAQLTPAEASTLMKGTEFVNAISNRLLSLSSKVKSLGVYFADSICQAAETSRIFEMDRASLGVLLPLPAKARDICIDAEDAWEILHAPEVVEPGEDVEEIERGLQPVSITEDSMGLSDEEDDPTIANSDPIPTPIYVRDLLAYLSTDTKSPQAYEKQKLALKTAPTLLRQKLNFGTEVSFFAEELLTVLAAMTNFFEELNFEALKLNAMIAVVVSYPQVTAHLCHLLLTGDYSLQQRMCLLSAMSLSAREMRGYLDEAVRSSYKEVGFASKMLPPQLHKQYMAAQEDYGYAAIENVIQNQLMAEASEEARNEIAGGKILRMSSTLRKQKPEQQAITREALVGFNKNVGRLFFFPLMAVWYESGGINIGHYTPVLISHFLRTLSLIMHAAYPSAVDLNDMVREYLGLVTPVIQKVTVDQIDVIESIVTGVLLVCDVLDDMYLVTNFQTSLGVIENAIAGWWEEIIEERVKSLCAGLLLRLAGLRSSFERVIMDQMNQGFL